MSAIILERIGKKCFYLDRHIPQWVLINLGFTETFFDISKWIIWTAAIDLEIVYA